MCPASSRTFLVFLFLFTVIFPAPLKAGGAGTITSAHRYAWSENTGWIDFGTTYGNVTVTDTALSGYAYGENIGWISLNCANTSSCATVDFKVSVSSDGDLSGSAWSENTGWINFGRTGASTGSYIDDAGAFGGWAWGENIGWISLNCANTGSCGTVSYGPQTTWRPPSGGGLLRKVTVVPSFTEPTASPKNTEPLVKPDPAKKPTTAPPQGEQSSQGVFVRDLQIGDSGEDVRALQTFLNKQGFLLVSSGRGAPGEETDLFGQRTFDALVRFQEAHAAEILTPLGLSKGTGYFGKSTRQFIAGIK